MNILAFFKMNQILFELLWKIEGQEIAEFFIRNFFKKYSILTYLLNISEYAIYKVGQFKSSYITVVRMEDLK